MAVTDKIQELCYEIPAVTPGILAPAVRTGNLVYTGGACSAIKGKLGSGVTVEEGYKGARDCILQNLASVQ